MIICEHTLTQIVLDGDWSWKAMKLWVYYHVYFYFIFYYHAIYSVLSRVWHEGYVFFLGNPKEMIWFLQVNIENIIL